MSDGMKADKSALSEVMNVAYAMHEFTSEESDAMLRFLLGDHKQCPTVSLPSQPT